MQKYVVLQVTLKEKLIGTASKNLSELEDVINKQADKGYRLHTISTTSGGSKGLGGGDRIQATMVFERIEQGYFIFLDSSVFEFFVYPLSFPNKNRIPRMRNFPGDSLY